LTTLEGATPVQRECLTADIAREFRRQEVQQKQDAELAEVHDNNLEREVLKLKDQFKTRDATWQQILHDYEERADQLLKQQKTMLPLGNKRIVKRPETSLTSNDSNLKHYYQP